MICHGKFATLFSSCCIRLWKYPEKVSCHQNLPSRRSIWRLAMISIINSCFAEFPPFQKHILDNKICQIVEIVARNDSEPYVRASAFKVLASMIKIKLLWSGALHELDIKVSSHLNCVAHVIHMIVNRNTRLKCLALKAKASFAEKPWLALLQCTGSSKFLHNAWI